MLKALSYLLEYGPRLSAWVLLTKATRRVGLHDISRRCARRKDKAALKIVKPLVKLAAKTSCEERPVQPSDYVWTMWWQGESKMPRSVKACIESQRRYLEGRHVVITEENVKDYLELPAYIRQRFREGSLDITHLSDLIRFELLYHYGGLWIDATVMVTAPFSVPNKQRLWTWKEPMPQVSCISKGRWCIGLIYTPKDHAFARYMCDITAAFWLEHSQLIDYYVTDLFIAGALRRHPLFAREWEVLNYRHGLYGNAKRLQKEGSTKHMEAFYHAAPLHYVTWKKAYPLVTSAGKPTVMKNLLDEFAPDAALN